MLDVYGLAVIVNGLEENAVRTLNRVFLTFVATDFLRNGEIFLRLRSRANADLRAGQLAVRGPRKKALDKEVRLCLILWGLIAKEKAI